MRLNIFVLLHNLKSKIRLVNTTIDKRQEQSVNGMHCSACLHGGKLLNKILTY